MNFKEYLQRPNVWGTLVSLAIMVIVASCFFYPDAFEGHTLQQADMQQGAANGHEGAEYQAATGEKALWTNSLFGGMPTFQISPSYPSNSLFTWLNTVYGLFLPAPANLLVMMMLGFYILLLALGLRWYYSLLGAIAWAFSSYFVIIIGAGHIWKFVTLTYIPPTIAGVWLCYRGRYLAGAAMTALFGMLQLNANHPQMTYYFGLVLLAIAVAYLWRAVRRKEIRGWLTATGIALGAGILALGANAPSLYNTYEYAKETKRSQSELTPVTTATDTPAERPTGGLSKQEITGWSYGRSEMFSLLIPNIKGGASARPEQGRQTYMSLDKLPEAGEYSTGNRPGGVLLPYLTQYFNDSEGTNGPVYVGAIVFALFLLGCIIVRGALKWTLLGATVLSLLLSLGYNLEWLSDLMIYHFPMYNKFRAVESILVVAEFTMPLLGVLGLHELLTKPVDSRRLRAVYISFGIPAALCLIAALAPQIFGPAITSGDLSTAASIQQQVLQMAQAQGYNPMEAQSALDYYSLSNPANAEAVTTLRYGLLKGDAWRSLLFLLLGGAVIWLSAKGKIRKPAITVAAIGCLVLIDLYGVDKRYVSTSSFTEQPLEAVFTPDAIDSRILADTTSHFRVMDIPGFNSPNRSYFHSMVGGYHAAKLNRYEDLIQRRLYPVMGYDYDRTLLDDSIVAQFSDDDQAAIHSLTANYRVLDMLNARYVITHDNTLVTNPDAMGPAWLPERIVWVDNADDEMAALGDIDLHTTAVADRKFADALSNATAYTPAPGDTIALTSYTPNRLTYSVTTASPAVAVFSEVYFPWGWKATVDGESVPLARVNYILRAVDVPAGHHTVVMTFDPDSLHTTGSVAYACVTLIYLLLIGALMYPVRKR